MYVRNYPLNILGFSRIKSMKWQTCSTRYQPLNMTKSYKFNNHNHPSLYQKSMTPASSPHLNVSLEVLVKPIRNTPCISRWNNPLIQTIDPNFLAGTSKYIPFLLLNAKKGSKYEVPRFCRVEVKGSSNSSPCLGKIRWNIAPWMFKMHFPIDIIGDFPL